MKNRVYLTNITGAYQVVLPYSCGLLHAYCLEDSFIDKYYDFQDYIFHMPKGVDPVLAKISDPAVLGLSLLSWNRARSLKLAQRVKAQFPDCLVIVGGPEVPDQCEDFLRTYPFVDIAVHKEGEIIFANLLKENLREDRDWKRLEGISFFDENRQFVHIPRTQKFMKKVDTPSPYLMGLFDRSLDYVDSLGIPRHTIWETNRGCPFSCTFCDWGSFVNQQVRSVEEERVFAEIDYLGQNFDEIHIADANFGILGRDVRIAEKLSQIMKSDKKLKSVHLTYTKNLNKNTMKIAKMIESLKPSRAGFTFGIQSFNKDVLANVKRDNIPRFNLKELKAELDQDDIPTNAEMILGLPGETRASFLDGIEEAIHLGLTDLRVYQVSMYPNSEMNDVETIEKFEIETEDILIVEGEEPDENEYIKSVVQTKDLNRSEMKYLKKMIEMIDHIHFGRWTFYLAQYFYRVHNIRIVDFYDRLATYFFTDRKSVLGKIATGVYINEWNSGSWNSFRGPKSPFGIQWGHNFFRKSTFFWLCIAEERVTFFQEIREFLAHNQWLDDKTHDLIRFQDSMIMEFSYDPQLGKEERFSYNWYDFFKNQKPLEKKSEILRFYDQKIGRFGHKLKPNDPQSYFYVAGGYKFHFQKIDSFEFSKVKPSYVQDFYEQRFEHRNIKSGG